MEFKRQTNRATKMDKTTNINLFFKGGFELGVCTSKGWGDFSEDNSNNPMIDIELDGKNYGMRLDTFKEILRREINEKDKALEQDADSQSDYLRDKVMK